MVLQLCLDQPRVCMYTRTRVFSVSCDGVAAFYPGVVFGSDTSASLGTTSPDPCADAVVLVALLVLIPAFILLVCLFCARSRFLTRCEWRTNRATPRSSRQCRCVGVLPSALGNHLPWWTLFKYSLHRCSRPFVCGDRDWVSTHVTDPSLIVEEVRV